LAEPSSNHPSPVVAILSSKVGSVEDNASGGLYAYRASKSAANNIAKSLSVDLADRANVVLLHPGYVRTDMTDNMGFIDPPESVAGMLKAIEATGNDTPFRWVDYKAEIIPF
jgi:NAD(P)-dependent dehydrogenase (short-subunit alcohol dehydrogenase family)